MHSFIMFIFISKTLRTFIAWEGNIHDKILSCNTMQKCRPSPETWLQHTYAALNTASSSLVRCVVALLSPSSGVQEWSHEQHSQNSQVANIQGIWHSSCHFMSCHMPKMVCYEFLIWVFCSWNSYLQILLPPMRIVQNEVVLYSCSSHFSYIYMTDNTQCEK